MSIYRMSEAEYLVRQSKVKGKHRPPTAVVDRMTVAALREQAQPKPQQHPGETKQGVMNKTEARFEREWLAHPDQLAKFSWYKFEALTFLLGFRCRYTPDFVVQTREGRTEIYEVKAENRKTGRYRITEDANVKVKLFPQLFPYSLYICWPNSTTGGWNIELMRKA